MENPYAIVPLLRGRWARLAAATVMGLALSGCLDDSQGDDNTPPPGNDDNDTTNEAPVADAGMDIQALVDESVQFDASGSQDPDGEIVDYSWSNSLTGETPSTSYDTADSYSVTLTVTDDAGATAQDTVTVVIEEDDGNNDDDQNNDDDYNEVEPYDGISLYLKQPEAWSEAYIHYCGRGP